MLKALGVLAEHQLGRQWVHTMSPAMQPLQLETLLWCRGAYDHCHARCLRTITDIQAAREESSIQVFDGASKALHRDRAAAMAHAQLLGTTAAVVAATAATGQAAAPASTKQLQYRSDPLLVTVADRLIDRLEDCKGRTFPHVCVIGGAVLQVLDQLAGSRAGVRSVTVIDTSPGMLQLVQDCAVQRSVGSSQRGVWPHIQCLRMDSHAEMLPVDPSTFDLVISCLGLHWINDLPTMLAQCRFALKPDGLFLGALFAGDTLNELRISCSLAQMERQDGVSPVVSPFAQVRDGGNLLTRAGLALPAVDVDELVVRYPGGPLELVEHLRALGEVNAVRHRQHMLRRNTALAAAAIYQTMFGDASDRSIPATYQALFLTGWAPHESQQRPAQRGSATVSFQDLADGLVQSGAAGGSTDGEEPANETDAGTPSKKG